MNKLNIKQPKDIEDECWEKFEKYLNEYASDEVLKFSFHIIWEMWYNGYVAAYPIERDLTEYGLELLRKSKL